MDWNAIRRDFPVTKKYVYLANAYGAPIPKQILKPINQFYEEELNEGDLPFDEWLERKEEVRKNVAKFINANIDEIAFTQSTSEGMNLIAHMISKKGDVITDSLEFPSSTLPWINQKANLKFVDAVNGKILIDDIRKHIDEKTKTIVTSHVQFSNGFRQDLEKLGEVAKQNNLFLVVNATQSMGVLPVDVKKFNTDFMCAVALKWLVASYGVAIFFMKKQLLNELETPVAGWLSVKNPDSVDNRKIDFKDSVSRFEVGNTALPAILGLGASIKYLQKIGIPNIEKRVLKLTDLLIEHLQRLNLEILSPLERKHRSQIVLFKVKNPKEIVEKLKKRKIIASTRLGGIRVSPHFFNNEDDIEKFIKNLKILI